MIYEFGDVRIDGQLREITRSGDPVSVQPQVLDLLLFLVSNPDRVVSKDELIDAVWEGRAITDSALNARINAARKVVGDTGETQTIIKTVPRKGYRFVANISDGSAPAEEAVVTRAPSVPSLTVLPFADGGIDTEHRFLADGLTEDVVTALSKLRGFFVTDRNTTFSLKDTAKDPRAVAEEMGVRYILQGSVRSAGQRIRVNASLTDTETNAQLWGERYDRDLTNIFDLQDELTESLVARLSPELYAAEHARLKRRPPNNLDSWECFVHAIHDYGKQSKDSSASAVVQLERAIELDPHYAQALGLYATILAWRVIQGWEPFDETLARARSAADRAVLADPNDPWASIGRGYVSITAREEAAAIMNYGRAVDLSPNFAYARALLGVSNAYAGNADLARGHIEKAIALSPLDTFIDKFFLYLAIAEFQAARYTEAADAAERAIQIKPGHASSHMFRAAAHALNGNQEIAEAACAAYLEVVPAATASRIEQTVLYYNPDDRRRMADGMRKAGLPD